MTDGGYTHGPWHAGNGGIYDSKNRAVIHWPVFHDPDDANLALLCAAPDLLQACETVLEALARSDGGSHERLLRSVLQTAIARARGDG